jgi:hypothetical protein
LFFLPSLPFSLERELAWREREEREEGYTESEKERV